MIHVRRTVLLTMAVFALQPLAFGAWLALIPDVKEAIGLSKAELALALLGMPLALIPVMPVAGMALARFGPRRILMAALPAQVLVIQLPLLAQSQMALFGALACVGLVMAFLQSGLNVYAGRLEKSLDLAVMNRCHGFWALGLTAGSLWMALMAGWSPWLALLIVSGVSSVLGVAVAARLPKLAAVEEGRAPPRRPLRALPVTLVYIALFGLAIGMTEGAMADWAAVYLAERWALPDAPVGIAVSIYAACLAAGRFAGDLVKRWLGAVLLARACAGLAIAGLGLLVLPLPLFAVFVGYACVGLGVSVGFPLAVSAVAALDDRYEAANIALLSMVTVSGFLIGPPMIGFLAEAFSLRVGLGVLIPLLAIGMWCAGSMRPVRGPARAESERDSAPIHG